MSELRAQHYVPQFILRNFTQEGSPNEHLCVISLFQKKQWRSLPSEAGHRRDFYRVEIEGVDPNIVEKFLSELEDDVAPVIRELIRLERVPIGRDEYTLLINFLAFSFGRIPSQREMLERAFEAMNKQIMRVVLETPDRWEEFLETRRREDPNFTEDNVGYSKMKEFVDRGEYSVKLVGTNYQVKIMLRTAHMVAPMLAKKHWGLFFSRSGEFICADRSSLFFASAEAPIHRLGIGSEDSSVAFPISRYILLVGSSDPWENDARYLNKKSVAEMNRIVLANTHRYVFSAAAEFPWMDRNGKVCYDLPEMALDESPPVVKGYVKGSSVPEELVEVRDRPLMLME